MSMFPSPLGREYNPGHSTGESGGPTPRPMRWGFGLAVLAAVVMLVTGMVLLSSVGTSRTEVPDEVVDTYIMNQRIVAWGNLVGGLALAALSPQLLKGRYRGWWAGFLVASIVVNALGLFVRVSGPASLVIIALLAFAAVFAYRPACNRFVRR
ncbi:hypothetical protein [Corynebacterium doosanense]|uniref:Tellurium resistance protein TerC n=1 Tax=Corynebacterium doosanense CAU 212 = DSM 45436 TaxID=558173 RepID=A0A097IJA0_9CORY|nr:hypothetical protein [Corynebacterium doosanense]AIT62199.1 hypothetical protein CDOO_02400 [Corynebacterium doosanense CAU 212 = DSM 45436]